MAKSTEDFLLGVVAAEFFRDGDYSTKIMKISLAT